ncbi:MAG: type II toxin-antitoxin system HicB family antitoxin [Dehalococcoidia bacterium]|nr:type II toxin-antitoxin system HicB family antitoxin [Dehalococcoidia bacterium]MDZ4277559.1 type II toxin-antitoxin system HicB family antitoxin [Dehalococcoidia bacterium]
MKASHRRFTAILLAERDPEFAGYYNAVVPALPGCVSYGASKEEALQNIREAIEAYLEDLEAEGEEIPEDHFEPVVVEV